MKKLLVVLLALMLVAGIAAVSFGLDETVSGTVGLQLSAASNADVKGFSSTPGDVGTGIVIKWGLTKEFSDVYSAGITLKIEDPAKAANDGCAVVSLDGDAYIKANLDPATVTFYANNKNMNVAKDLVGDGLYDMASGAGVGVDYKVSDALVVNTLLTSSKGTALNSADGTLQYQPVVYNYAVKGTYTSDALTLGAGIQQDGSYNPTTADKKADGHNVLDVNASMKLGDSLTVSAEYAGRTGAVEAAAELLKGTFTADALTVNGMFLNKAAGYQDLKVGDGDGMNVYDLFRRTVDEGSALSVDATYKLSDTLSVNGALQNAMDNSMAEADRSSLKVGLSDKLTDAVVVDAYYQIHNLATKLDGKITDTLAEGLVASLEVSSNTDNVANATSYTSYTAKIVATL